MVAGRHPDGFPLAPPKPGEPTVEQVDRMTTLVFGPDVKLHPITRRPLENGSGALPPDDQARHVHVPHILKTHGIAAARAVLAKLDAAMKPKERK
jgi:hypothetical protein